MRTLGVVEFVTLDGVTQGFHAPDPDDPGFPHGGWGLPYQNASVQQQGTEGQRGSDDQTETTAYLFGRRTYQALAAFWPSQPDSNPMAYHLNHNKKYVATRSLSTLDWSGAQVLEGELPEAVRAIKQEGAGRIVVLGSADLVQQLLPHGLVDTFTLFVHPLVLGTGKRLFRDLDKPMPLELRSVNQAPNGVLTLDYTAA